MSFTITIFGPKHYFWKEFKQPNVKRYWYWKPDQHSTGGTGICIPFLHIVFMWGKE
jgi:hypothetical protein